MAEIEISGDARTGDPYIDRRSGEERRQVYDADYFATIGIERRNGAERRRQGERRDSCVRITKWSSVCPE